MDSSPRPLRRYSRWKTSKCTFVLGGKKYGKGNKSSRQNDVKDGQNQDFRSKLRSSPRLSQDERFSLHTNGLTKDLAANETPLMNMNGKADMDHSQDPSISSKKEQSICPTSSHALSVLSPNVSTAKDVLVSSVPNKHCDIVENDLGLDENIRSNSGCQINHNEIREDLESNPESPSGDKENSSTTPPIESDISTRLGNTHSKESAQSSSRKSKNEKSDVEDQSSGNLSRKQTLRDRKLLVSSPASSAEKNHLSSSSKREKTVDKGKGIEDVQLSLYALNDTKIRAKEAMKTSADEMEDCAKYEKKNSREKTNVKNSHKIFSSIRVDEDVKLSMNTSVDLIDVNFKGESSSSAKSFVISPSRLSHLENDVATVVRPQKSAVERHSDVGSHSNNSIGKTSDLHSHLKYLSQRKQTEHRKEKYFRARKSPRLNTKEVQIKTSYTVNCSKNIAGDEINAKSTKKASINSPATQTKSKTVNVLISQHSLRDRSCLAVPEIQYPAKYMSASQINSLSDKAMRVLSISRNDSKAVMSHLSSSINKSSNHMNGKEGHAQGTKTKNSNSNSKSRHLSLGNSVHHEQLNYAICPLQTDLYKKSLQGSKNKEKPSTSMSSLSGNVRNNHCHIQKLLPGNSQERKTLKKRANMQLSVKVVRTKGKNLRSLLQQDTGSNCGIPKNSHEISEGKRLSIKQDDEISQGSMIMPRDSPECRCPSIHSKARKVIQLPGPSQSVFEKIETGNLNVTTLIPNKNPKRRRLFQDTPSKPKKLKLSQDLNIFENDGKDILLWSEMGEERKATSATSLDVVLTNVIEMEDQLRDSETDPLLKQIIGKVIGQMKRSLKSHIHHIEKVKGMEADIKKSHQKCNKIKAEISELDEQDKRLQKKVKEAKESKQSSIHDWMENLRSLMISSRQK